jgi:hypothetical protein
MLIAMTAETFQWLVLVALGLIIVLLVIPYGRRG